MTASCGGKAGGLNIVAVINTLGAGGAEKVLAHLSRDWLASGHSVAIISFDRPSEPIFHSFPDQVSFDRLACLNEGARTSLRRLVLLRRSLNRHAPDIVVSFLTKINVLTLLATVGTKVPVIVSERNNTEAQPAHPVWMVLLTKLYCRAAVIVCQTAASVRCIPKASRHRVLVIPNAVTPPHRRRQVSVPPRIVAVGRLTHQKGFDLLIEAFANLGERRAGWQLEIWGEGPQRAALERQVSARDLSEFVRLPGQTARPGEWIDQAGAFVLSSRYEGFANVLSEAMAAGLPVLSFDCDFGPSELIIDRQNGLLVADGDVESLTNGMAELFSDPDLRAKLGANATAIVDRLSMSKISLLWKHAFQRALDPT